MSKSATQNNFLIPYLIFLIFGLISADQSNGTTTTRYLLGAILALVVAWFMIKILTAVVNGANKELRQQEGPGFGKVMVSRGLFFMIPFVILAILAQYVLGWNAGMAFASAAITTGAASTGMEAIKEGAKGAKNVIVPTIVGTIASTVWMLLITLIP